MTNVTYTQLTSLINNSGLTVGEEYTVTDYPTFQPVLTARTTDELWRDGYAAGGYKLLYDPFNNGKYGWSSNYGWVYYLEDSTGTSAWCDWKNTPGLLRLQNSTNIKILPNIVSNQYKQPNLTVRDSSNLIISGTTTMTFINCRNMTVGGGNTGTASDIDNGVIGDSNTNILVKNASIVNIGKNNVNVTVKNCNGVEVNDNNEDLNVSSGNNIIGSDNINLDIQGENNQILNNCNTVTVTDDLNIVENSKFVDIDSAYNTVRDSNSVTLKDSVGNTIEDSRLVYLDSVNDNYVWATNYVNSPNSYTTPNGDTIQYNSGVSQPFQSVKNRNQQKVGKININQLEEQKYQVDNAALVIDTDNNTRKNSTKADDNYYIGKDGLWNAEGINTDEYDVVVVISKTDSQKCYISGAGRYQNGATCTLNYSWIETGLTCTFVDENNVQHSAPYTFIVTDNRKINLTLS